jgi:hypothetical protein
MSGGPKKRLTQSQKTPQRVTIEEQMSPRLTRSKSKKQEKSCQEKDPAKRQKLSPKPRQKKDPKQPIFPKLECDVCQKSQVTKPVQQCLNGHIICPECQNQEFCPVCYSSNQKIRSLLADQILDLSKSHKKEDLAILVECPVCLGVPILKPMYQCSNGHLVCFSCQKLISDSCPSCKVSLNGVKIRSLLADKIIDLLNPESKVQIFCINFN